MRLSAIRACMALASIAFGEPGGSAMAPPPRQDRVGKAQAQTFAFVPATSGWRPASSRSTALDSRSSISAATPSCSRR